MRSFIKEHKGKYIVYMPDSLRFFQANRETVKIVKMLESGMPVETVMNQEISADTGFVQKLYSLLNEKSNLSTTFPQDVLPRLVINISNSCNMGCKYCYANGGNYQSEAKIMKKELLKEILDKFYSMYKTIGVIQLFGGEPMLNPEAVRYTCEYMEENGKKTEVGMVTNGTILSDEMIELIKEKNLFITVSIDEQSVHDLIRPFKSGEKSFDVIKENIKKLKVATNQPGQLEVTYTKVHADLEISIKNLVNALHKAVGKIPVHIAPVCTSDKEYWLDSSKIFKDSIKDYFDTLGTDNEFKYSFVESFLIALKEKVAKVGICSAGVNTISVSVDGTIYPCFYFTDQKEFEICSIHEKLETIRAKLVDTRKNYKENKSEQCKECHANTVCFGCLGVNSSETGNCYETSAWRCKMIKESLSEVLQCLEARREANGEMSKTN